MGSIAGIFLAIYFKKVPIYVGERESTTYLQDQEEEKEIGKEGEWDHTYPGKAFFQYTYRKK
jgi:hypothetical protein